MAIRHLCQLIRQRDPLLVRHFALDVLQEGALDRVGVRLVSGFELLAVAALLLGGCEGHGGHARTVTLPSSSPVYSGVCDGRPGVVFLEEFSLRCRGICRPLAFRRWVKNAAKSAISAIFGAENVVRPRWETVVAIQLSPS